jgi:uncharacterized protein YggU (UPF0235/DUF167 family)
MFGGLHVYTRARPQNGEANAKIAELLAEHFSVAPSCVILKRGHTSKEKMFEILM